MKRLVLLSFLLFFYGCSQHSHQPLFAQADRLMTDHPDSAYALIQTIDPDQLPDSESLAYYALLYTKAQYKCLDSIPNDSLIDIALAYYTKTDHPLLAEAMMYKGAALEDMGRDPEAMQWYKDAEIQMAPLDYTNMGLINIRLGGLYHKRFDNSDTSIKRYKIALRYHQLAHNTAYINDLYRLIGRLYTLRNRDSASYYLNKAVESARIDNDSLNLFKSMAVLAMHYEHQKEYEHAKNIALYVLHNHSNTPINHEAPECVSRSYAGLGELDSALYYSNQITPSDARTQVCRYITLRAIEECRGNYKKALEYNSLGDRLSDSILDAARSVNMQAAEKQYDVDLLQYHTKKLESQNIISILIIIICCLGALCLGILLCIAIQRKKRIVSEKLTFIDQLQTDIQAQQITTQSAIDTARTVVEQLNINLNNKAEIESQLKVILDKRITVMRQLMKLKYEYGDNPAQFVKQFDSIMATHKQSKASCENVIHIANLLNYHIIDELKANHTLSFSEVLLLSLVSLNFSPTETRVFLNSASTGSVYTLRSRLHKKLKTSSLETYVEIRIKELNLLYINKLNAK